MDLSSNEKKEKPEAKYNKIFPLISLQDPSSVGSLSHRQIPCLIRQLSRRIRASLSKILQSSPRVWSYSANNAQSWRWSRRDIVRVTRACVWSAPSPQRLRGEWPRIRPDSRVQVEKHRIRSDVLINQGKINVIRRYPFSFFISTPIFIPLSAILSFFG